MPKPSLSILTVLLGAFVLAPGTLPAQGTPYADPQHRFTVQVPDGWTTQQLGDQGLEVSGDGLSILITPLAAMAAPQDVVAKLVRQISSDTVPLSIHGEGSGVRWQNLQEVDRRSTSIPGQQAEWILFDGTDPKGKPGTIRLQGIQGGGVTAAVVISGEQAIYFHQRGTVEAILATLRLGTNPPVAFATYPTSGGNAPPAAQAPPPDTASNQAGMGVEVRDVDDDDVRQFNLADDEGVVVEQVRQGGPADQAGIRENDVILQVDRTQVDGAESFERLLGTHQPGDAIELLVGRNGRRRVVSVRLEAEP